MIRLVDAITHSIESKNSILTNLISEAYSDYVIKNSIEFINYILKTKNKYLSTSEIKKLCIFSLYGGMAQSETGSGLCHALAHTLEKNYKLPHSEAIFLCLMISLKYKRSSKNHKKDLLIFKSISRMYEICFSKREISKHKNLLKKLNIIDFISEAKRDPCWKLEKDKIQETQLNKIFRKKLKYSRWNI